MMPSALDRNHPKTRVPLDCSRGTSGRTVEMAGVEPASEERTIEITTHVVSLSSLAPP